MSRAATYRRLALALWLSLALAGCPEDEPAETDAGADVPAADLPSEVVGDAGADVLPDTGPDPQTLRDQLLAVPESEAWTMPGLTAPVQVVRVEANIPHIYAQNPEDLARVLGFVVARDRFFIMDLQRRMGLGTLSELLGDAALEADMETRYTGATAIAHDMAASANPENAAWLDAYAEGINFYIDQVKAGELPPPSELELFAALLGFATPADMMTPFDRLGVAGLITVVVYEMNYETGDPRNDARARQIDGLFEGVEFEALRKAGMLGDIYNWMAPLFPTTSAAGFGIETGSEADGGPPSPSPRPRPAPDAAPFKAARRPIAHSLLDRTVDRLERVAKKLGRDHPRTFGSNAWAVAGSATTDGASLLAGDGHLSFYYPSIFYQIGMNTRLFGDGDIHQTGLLIQSLPMLAVGTNGKVAWSQVNPYTDLTDWYREELQLDADGAPQATLYEGEWQPLVPIDETYEVADVQILGSEGRTESWTRWETFDGRWIYDIEGREVSADEPLAPGETLTNLGGKLIVPGDEDGDGVVTAISFDYTGFEGAGYLYGMSRFGLAEDVHELRDLHRGQIGGGLWTAAADHKGNILYSSYLAMPCRTYLQRNADGTWTEGSDPTMLLDGTVYRGFEVPTDAEGLADEGPGQTDPYKCLIPLDDWPQAINPDKGFVATANNQPAPITDDNSLTNDPWYLGGPWDSIRVNTISRELAEAVAEGSADVAKMAEIQANNQSRLGELFASHLIEAVTTARTLSQSGGAVEDHEQRLVALYEADAAAMDEAADRLAAWGTAGYYTPSGVETFYHQPTDQDKSDAVATMLFNTWFPRLQQLTFNDEPMGIAYRYSGSRTQYRAMRRFLDGRGPGNSEDISGWNPDTEESIFFDDLGTPGVVERSREVILAALTGALEFLRSDPTDGGTSGGFGTTDMTQYIWGLRHKARFESVLAEFLLDDPQFAFLADTFSLTTEKLPLAPGIQPGDPRAKLKWFPRGSDNHCVDAGSPGFSGTHFTFGSGPIKRMVIALKDGQVWGQNIIPGGQSAILESDFFADQVKLWLANDTLPLRFHPQDVAAGATGREVYSPQ